DFLRNALAGYGGSIAAKLYFFATLSIVAVVALAGSSLSFARVTEVAAVRLYDQGFLGTQNSARLGLLLEQHRRIVESMPSEVDRQRIDRALRELDDTQAKLEALMRPLTERRTLPPAALERPIAPSLPYLFEAGQRVIFYAREFAQDKATEKVIDYSHVADGIQVIVRDYRDQRLHDADDAVAFMLFSAKSLTIAVLICAFIAFILIGPIGLTSMHRVLSRLGEVTGAMAKLARHDTTAAVPYRSRRDRRNGARRRGVQGRCDPADLARGGAQAAQQPHRRRAQQHDARAVHVRCRREADRLQCHLRQDVRADRRRGAPRYAA